MSRKKRKEREFKQAYREKFSEERHPPEIKPLTDNQKWNKENLLNKSVSSYSDWPDAEIQEIVEEIQEEFM